MKFIQRGIVFSAVIASTMMLQLNASAQSPRNNTGQNQRSAQAAVNNQVQAQVQQQIQAQARQQIQAQAQQQAQQQVQAQAQQQVQAQAQQQVQAQARQQIQAQARQQTQNHVQQQAQAQQQAGLQVQSMLQADISRAAGLLQQAGSSQAQLSASNQASANLNRRVNENAGSAVANSLGVRSSANLNSRAATNLRGAVNSQRAREANTIVNLPPGITIADAKLYDKIFGQHNPFRESDSPRRNAQRNLNANSRSGNNINLRGATKNLPAGQKNVTAQGSTHGQETANQLPAGIQTAQNVQADLSTRVETAINQRRSEISIMRDEAIETGNQQKMRTADKMEMVLDTFVKAQAQARASASAAATGQIPSVAENIHGSGSAETSTGTTIK